MNKLLVGLLAATAILLVGLNSRAHDDFEAFKAQYGREYQGAEDAYRRAVFMTNFRKIQEHNSNPKKSFTMGVNQFADVTDQEFVENYLGDKTGRAKHQVDDQITVGDVDWRDGGITSIKNQGQCGSCWAFAATAAHESYQILTRGEDNTIALSPQQLVDCSNISPYENAGCNGGYGFHGLEYIKDFGQTTE
jgi:C1A family cysteine protease